MAVRNMSADIRPFLLFVVFKGQSILLQRIKYLSPIDEIEPYLRNIERTPEFTSGNNTIRRLNRNENVDRKPCWQGLLYFPFFSFFPFPLRLMRPQLRLTSIEKRVAREHIYLPLASQLSHS